jgi:hypothetical protein
MSIEAWSAYVAATPILFAAAHQGRVRVFAERAA